MIVEIFQDDDGIWRGDIKPLSATNKGGNACHDTFDGLMDSLRRMIPRVLSFPAQAPATVELGRKEKPMEAERIRSMAWAFYQVLGTFYGIKGPARIMNWLHDVAAGEDRNVSELFPITPEERAKYEWRAGAVDAGREGMKADKLFGVYCGGTPMNLPNAPQPIFWEGWTRIANFVNRRDAGGEGTGWVSTSSDIRRELLANLRSDKTYRDAFVEERIFARLPLKLKNMRGQMTQNEMAKATGKAQTWISKLEDPNYGRFTIATLLELAHFHDVGLEIDFVPFSRLLDEVVNPNVRRVPSFAEEMRESSQSDDLFDRGAKPIGQVTHWQPLPAAPAEPHKCIAEMQLPAGQGFLQCPICGATTGVVPAEPQEEKSNLRQKATCNMCGLSVTGEHSCGATTGVEPAAEPREP
jgi:transcriptional regulator with XRE-family HTH domain